MTETTVVNSAGGTLKDTSISNPSGVTTAGAGTAGQLPVTVEATPVTLNKPANLVIENDFTFEVHYTQTKGTLIKITSPEDPRLTEWAQNGYKVWFQVHKAGELMSGRTMRAEAAQAEWRNILKGIKSPIPMPMPNDRTGDSVQLEDILKRLAK